MAASSASVSAAPLVPPAAPATERIAAWTDAPEGRQRVSRAGIDVPHDAGSLKLTEVADLGTEGLDTVAQYESSDEAISGTAFVYYPTLADTGLTFLATDATIRKRFGPQTKLAEDRLVTIGGVSAAGRRVVYAGASGGRRSTSALFVRAGGWMVVLRVSGPASRSGEIGSDLDALAAGLRFGTRNNPVPAHVIVTSNCAAAKGKDAPLIKPATGEVGALLILAASGELRDEKGKTLPDMVGRVPDRLCLAGTGDLGEGVALTYRVEGPPKGLFAPTYFRLVGDAGYIVEATAAANRPDNIMLVRHQIGRLSAFGFFKGVPSLAQIERATEAGAFPLIGAATLRPEGGANLNINCSATQEGCPQAAPKS
jgi:hypothetical protein